MQTDNPYILKKLDWDTQHFGVSAARLELFADVTAETAQQIIAEMAAYEFVAIRNQNNRSANNLFLNTQTQAILLDSNIYYRRQTDSQKILAPGITICEAYAGDEAIIELIEGSYVNTRFFKDPHISVEKAQAVYDLRVRNAFGKAGKYFIVHEIEGRIAGFALMSKSNEELTCELVAVSADFRGVGIGQKITDAFDVLAMQLNLDQIMIPTQADNLGATRLYARCGYLPSEFHTIYHLWNRA